MIGQLTLQQGIHQPAATAHPQPVANPVAANPMVVNPMPANPQQNYQEGYRIKVDLQNFSGSLDVESVLDWLVEVERFFEIMNVEEERKVPIVAYKLKGGRAAWWNSIQNERYRKRLEPIRNWVLMKQMFEQRFLPSDHAQVLYNRRDSKGKAVTTTIDKGGRTNPYQKPTEDICYWCRQSGHRSNNCPERRGDNTDCRQVNIVEQVAETDKEVDDDDGSIAGSKDGEVTYVVKKILCSTKQEDETQRRKIFQAKFEWIKKGPTIEVNRIYSVPISIGKSYTEPVNCDVVDMDCCGILLGRPWQFDVDALHKGKENSYTFTWNQKKITILPSGSAKHSKVEEKNVVAISTGVQKLSSAVEKSGGTLTLLVREKSKMEDAPSLPPPVKELLKEFPKIVEES
ncbi:hypothetical protein MANES_16G058925v8 [Manihot esculenta]|uniref:Uncharacterized protein n=1 Tax=Manihot esculenta TaxID=3983 RepID=A0ACC8CBL8_MANES|nr:hypothetical protein MANES_16G058925v8 [Manihot esculenta]